MTSSLVLSWRGIQAATASPHTGQTGGNLPAKKSPNTEKHYSTLELWCAVIIVTNYEYLIWGRFFSPHFCVHCVLLVGDTWVSVKRRRLSCLLLSHWIPHSDFFIEKLHGHNSNKTHSSSLLWWLYTVGPPFNCTVHPNTSKIIKCEEKSATARINLLLCFEGAVSF